LSVCRYRRFEGPWRGGGVPAVLLLCLLLAACSHFGRRPAKPAKITIPPQRKLLIYANRIPGFDDRQLHDQLRRANRQFKRHPSSYSRLKLALLLMSPDTPVTDYKRAQSLLSNDPGKAGGKGSNTNTQLTALAQYLLVTVKTRQKMLSELSKERGKRHKLERKIKKVVNVVGDTQHPKGTH